MSQKSHLYLCDLILQNLVCFGVDQQTVHFSTSIEPPGENKKGVPGSFNSTKNPESKPLWRKWQKWTIVLGDNGAGKTTLLKAIAQLSPGKPGPMVIKSTATTPLGFQQGLGIERMVRDQNNVFALDTYKVWQGIPNQVGELKWVEGGYGFEKGFNQPNILAKNGPEFLLDLNIIAYGASRHLGFEPFEETNEPPHPVSNLFARNAKLINVVDWLLKLHYKDFKQTQRETETSTKSPSQFEKIAKILTGLLPDVSALRPNPEERNTIEAKWAPTGNPKYSEQATKGQWVNIRDLSLGYTTLFALAGDLICRLSLQFPNLEDPTQAPAIVLIDEIDLHLHPKWQTQIIGMLDKTFPNVQFIVTSHSPLVVQSAPDANLILLEWDGDHVVIKNDIEDSVNPSWRVDQFLVSDLFDLPSSRSLEIEKLMQERKRILTQPEITPRDEEKLKLVEEKLGKIDVFEDKYEKRAFGAIDRLIEILKEEDDDPNQ